MACQAYKLKDADGYYIKYADVFGEEKSKRKGWVTMLRHGYNKTVEVTVDRLIPAEIPKTKLLGWAYLDDGDFYPCQYDPNERWNGFAVPSFDASTFETLLEVMECQVVPTPLEEDEEEGEYYEQFSILPVDQSLKDVSDDELRDEACVVRNKKTGRYEFTGYCWNACRSVQEVCGNDFHDTLHEPMVSKPFKEKLLEAFAAADIQDFSRDEIGRCLQYLGGMRDRNTERLIQEALFQGEIEYVPQ